MLWDFEDDDEARDPSTMTPIEIARLGLANEIYQLHEKLRFGRKAPAVLWHYTSGASLLSIVESATLWATQVSCLNDQQELLHAAQLLRNEFKALKEGHTEDSDHVFLDRVIEELAVDLALQSPVFIASFSEQANDLNQWRSYAGGEGGYVLGFDYRGVDFGQPDDDFILPVIYEPDQQIEIMKATARELLQAYRSGVKGGEDPHDFTKSFAIPVTMDALTVLGPFLKHESFKAEAEWRVVSHLPAGDESRLKFRQKQSMLSRHLPMDFHRNGQIMPSGKLPLAFLGVGPSRHQGVSVNSVTGLLKSKGYPTSNGLYPLLQTDGFHPSEPAEVIVWASDIPFRGT